MKSIAVDEATHADVKKTAGTYELTIGDFIKHSVKYFKKTGINPAKPDDDSPKKAIAENNKRLNEVIAFIRTQETTHLLPLLGKLERTNLLIVDLINEVNKVRPETPEITEEIIIKEVKKEEKQIVEEIELNETALIVRKYKLYTQIKPEKYESIEAAKKQIIELMKTPDKFSMILKSIPETEKFKVYEDVFYDLIIHGKITEAYGYKLFNEELSKRINLKIVKSPEETFASYKNRIIKILSIQ